jgi:hypothetical protein
MPRLGDPIVVKVVFSFPRPLSILNPQMWSKSDFFLDFTFSIIVWSAGI